MAVTTAAVRMIAICESLEISFFDCFPELFWFIFYEMAA